MSPSFAATCSGASTIARTAAIAALLWMVVLSSASAAQESLVSALLPEDSVLHESSNAVVPIEPAGRSKITSAHGTDEILAEKRLFGVLPNHRADQAQSIYVPLSPREKFAIARSDSFDWPNYFLLVGYAMQSQFASGGFAHNGGASGFAKFYARSVGDQIIGSYVTEAILPTLLRQDPRFFRLGTGSLVHRASHATLSILLTKTDGGRTRFNYSEVAGNAGVVALTTIYYPGSRAASEGVERLGMALGNDVISNLLTEFWPDIKHHLVRRKRPI